MQVAFSLSRDDLDFEWNPASSSLCTLPAEWTVVGARESVGKLVELASNGRENTPVGGHGSFCSCCCVLNL